MSAQIGTLKEPVSVPASFMSVTSNVPETDVAVTLVIVTFPDAVP
jgi:hypothetical protein